MTSGPASRPQSASASASKTRLVIRVDVTDRTSPIRLALGRLRARYAGGPMRRGGHSLRIEVHDLRGRRVGLFADAGVLSELPLPAGTYVITTTRGKERRGYTLTLQEGASFELQLAAAPA